MSRSPPTLLNPCPLPKSLSQAWERDFEIGSPSPDYENVALKDDINEYVKREVLPHVPDAWVDESKTRIGYEIPFTRHFYEYVPPRPLEEIEQEIKDLEEEIRGMLEEIL